MFVSFIPSNMFILLLRSQNGSNIGTGYDYKKCVGLKVKPRQGDGLLFYSVFPNGTIDRVTILASNCT